jgi:hypothetical protein
MTDASVIIMVSDGYGTTKYKNKREGEKQKSPHPLHG